VSGFALAPVHEKGSANAFVEAEWRQYLAGLQAYLDRVILGQTHATARIAQTIQAAELGFNARQNKQPKASFLFLGPTGVGKTESTKRFTEYLYGENAETAVLFMNEYGSEETLESFRDRLEMAIRGNADGTTLLFDEIEKAHPKIIDIFISLLWEGLFTARSGEKLCVEDFYVVMTSNLGSGDLARMENSPFSLMERTVFGVARERMRPELFARFTERIVFKPLGIDIQRDIIRTRIEAKLRVLSGQFGRPLTYDKDRVIAFIFRSDKKGGQGARMLAQEVDRQFNHAALPWGLSGKMPEEGKFYYDSASGTLVMK
jgi:ATP-dependent Clp protease ATP-binding subunit ClpA